MRSSYRSPGQRSSDPAQFLIPENGFGNRTPDVSRLEAQLAYCARAVEVCHSSCQTDARDRCGWFPASDEVRDHFGGIRECEPGCIWDSKRRRPTSANLTSHLQQLTDIHIPVS